MVRSAQWKRGISITLHSLILLCSGLTQIVNQDPVFVFLLLLLPLVVSRSAALAQLFHVVPEQSAGEHLEHPGTSF